VDGRRLRDGLMRAAQHFGAVVEHDTARLRVTSTGCAVDTSHGELGADALVVAAGAWTNDVLGPLGFRVAVQPQRGQLVHLQMDGADTSAWPSVLPPTDHYLVAFDGGRIVVGATRETGAGFDPRITAAGLREVLENALAVAPGLAAATVVETRVGLRPLAADKIPAVGPVPGVAGVYVNAGFGAAGLTMAPAVGAALAQLVLTGSSDLDLNAAAPR
jgi:D-amino-acid dehydrogenase